MNRNDTGFSVSVLARAVRQTNQHPCLPLQKGSMAMQYQVIITDHVEMLRKREDERPRTRRVKTGFINVGSRAEAEQVADLLQNRTGLSAEPVLKMWQPGGGSVTLDFVAIERIATEFLDGGGKSEGKPSFAHAAE